MGKKKKNKKLCPVCHKENAEIRVYHTRWYPDVVTTQVLNRTFEPFTIGHFDQEAIQPTALKKLWEQFQSDYRDRAGIWWSVDWPEKAGTAFQTYLFDRGYILLIHSPRVTLPTPSDVGVPTNV
jgi:hypothetical protein